MINDLLSDAESRMKGAVSSLEEDLAAFRTGRANPHLVDKIIVEAYGVDMPLMQLANISVPEAQQIMISPYDAKNITAIERGIMKSDLGLMPNNDGRVIRLNLPRLTEERRRELKKLVAKRVEEAKVAVRNVRRDAQNSMRDLERDKEITEDQLHKGQDRLQELTDKHVAQIDEIGKEKEAEIMEV